MIGTVAVVAAAPDLLVTVVRGTEILETLAVMIPMTATREESVVATAALLAVRMIVVIVTGTGRTAAIDAKTETMTLIRVTAAPMIVAVAAKIKAAAIGATDAEMKRMILAIGEEAETGATIAAMTLVRQKARMTRMFAALNRASISKTKKVKSRSTSTRKPTARRAT